MNRKIAFLLAAFALAASAYPSDAQPAEKFFRIGFLTSGSAEFFKPRLAVFREGLRDLGYVEGRNIVIEARYAGGRRERLPELAAELVGLDVDLIVTHGGRLAQTADRAARAAGRTIPMVFAVDADPVGKGVVASLARPGGNITGLSDSHSQLVAKRLELLKMVVPSATRVAVFWHPDARLTSGQLKSLQAVAPGLGVTLFPLQVYRADDVDRAFAAIRRERPDALNVLGYQPVPTYRRRIVAFALENRLPTIFTSERWPAAGGLMSYGINFLDQYRRAASFVDKILKGAKPADLPVEQPTRFYLTVNLKTAKAIGVTFPPSILMLADKVIE